MYNDGNVCCRPELGRNDVITVKIRPFLAVFILAIIVICKFINWVIFGMIFGLNLETLFVFLLHRLSLVLEIYKDICCSIF